MKVVVVSDTHGKHERLEVPDGDVLIHAGDLTGKGSLLVLESLGRWLRSLPHENKIVIAGNHDFCLEDEQRKAEAESLLDGSVYLRDEAVTIDGVRFWGSPWQPKFHNWAFNLPRGTALREKWNRIPDNTDVLITHGPPRGIGDRVKFRWKRVGCKELHKRVEEIDPELHVFGHIHEGYGRYEKNGTRFLNASSCNFWNRPVHEPLVFEL